MAKQPVPWNVTPLLGYRSIAFISSTVVTTPLALIGFWVLASWADSVRYNEDSQMIILGCALPFAALCIIVNMLVHRKLYRGHTPSKRIIRTSLFALLLAWPMMVLSVILTGSLPLPMVDERTPTISTLWIILVLGWWLLTLICGVILSMRSGVDQMQQRKISHP
jgi:hypothetical protein